MIYPSPETGDVILVDNTSDETAEVYGKVEIYNGEEWVETESSDALSLSYKDALTWLSSGKKTIFMPRKKNIY